MEMTICNSTRADIKKLGFLLTMVILSFATGAVDTKSLYAVVIIQALGNIDTFSDILGNQLIERKTKDLVTVIVISSILAGTIAVTYWYGAWAWMDYKIIEAIFVIVVSLPVLFWTRDFQLNREKNR